MEKAISYGGTSVVFADNGKGNPVVLLHGYLESQEIWYSFAEKLQKSGNRVITLDLPGHGLSGVAGEEHSMDFQAGAVLAVLNDLKLEKCALVGHSMGGYVSLAFAKNYPERLAGLCLFHSTPNPDSDEKRANRDREIELVKGGKVELIAKTNIPMAFARENHKKMVEQIEEATLIAMETEPDGIIACLRGMKSRPDTNDVLEKLKLPVVLIFGKKDAYISEEVAQNMAQRFSMHQTVFLENSGHMGFMEEEARSVELIANFVGGAFDNK